MLLFSKPATAARTAVTYITIGALTLVWTVIWFVWLMNHPPESSSTYYWCAGFAISGLAMLAIGLGLGRIGRATQNAEVPAAPVEAKDGSTQLQEVAAVAAPPAAAVVAPRTAAAASPPIRR